MKGRRDMDDPEFDARWRVFAADEARVQAPGQVGPAVMAAWDAAHAQPRGVQRRRRRNVPALTVLAAAALLLAVGLAVRHGSGRGSGAESSGRSGHASLRESAPDGQVSMLAVPARAPAARPAERPGALQERPQARVSRPVGRTALRDRAAVSGAAAAARIAAGPIVTLAADRAFEAEVFHIMRVRVPRGALQPFGVSMLEPEASGLVDVDVLVGDDGLARDIRRISPVIDPGAGYNR